MLDRGWRELFGLSGKSVVRKQVRRWTVRMGFKIGKENGYDLDKKKKKV